MEEVKHLKSVIISLKLLQIIEWCDIINPQKMNTETYRSGHNGADSKSVWGNPREFESHRLRNKPQLFLVLRFSLLCGIINPERR